MIATGIVRRIDELGRIVIPKEIRRTLGINDGDPLEIFRDRDGSVILKKYDQRTDMEQWAQEIITKHGNSIVATTVVSRETMVVLTNGRIGKSKCMPTDKMNFNIGVAIAIAKVLNLDIPNGI